MLQILNAVFSLFFPALAALLFVNLKQVTNASGSAGIEQKNEGQESESLSIALNILAPNSFSFGLQ